MSIDRADGYVQGLDYTHGYCPEMAPARLELACVARGFPALPAGRPIRYLELAFGQGVSVKITTQLERVGDEAKKIALQARRIFQDVRLGLPRHVEIRRIAQMVLAMLHTSLLALERLEVTGAGGVAGRDLDVDDAFRGVLRELISCMIEDPRTISASLDLLFVAKSLERVGDHAKNIAEQVIYAVEGKEVRHASDPAPGK